MKEDKLKAIEKEINVATSLKPWTWILIIMCSAFPLFALPGITETNYRCDTDQTPIVCKTHFTGLYMFLIFLTAPIGVYLGGIYRIKYLLKKKDHMVKALENAKVEQEKEKEIRAKELEENASKKRKELKEKYAHLRTFAKDAEWYSFLAGTVCIGMHRELVNAIKGVGYDEKRTITSKVTKLTYKYQPYLNARKTTSYKLQVTFIDDRVNAFKDL